MQVTLDVQDHQDTRVHMSSEGEDPLRKGKTELSLKLVATWGFNFNFLF